jgi:iron complex transport system permease protein
VLIGVAVNALTGALIGLAIFYADENQLSTFTFWTLGDLGGATWEKLSLAAPILFIATTCLLVFGRALNALSLGESEAYHMGVNVEQIKRLMILLSALAVGVSVSLAGIIGFIGLVVPHVIRTVFHSDNRLVLPASALGGALLLLLADIIARTVVSPAELPIGVVTALIGAPFFITLLLKAKRKQEL